MINIAGFLSYEGPQRQKVEWYQELEQGVGSWCLISTQFHPWRRGCGHGGTDGYNSVIGITHLKTAQAWPVPQNHTPKKTA